MDIVITRRHSILALSSSKLANSSNWSITSCGDYVKSRRKQLDRLTTTCVAYLYKIVVLPAPSKPNIRIRISFEPHNEEKRLEKKDPKEITYHYVRISHYFIHYLTVDD